MYPSPGLEAGMLELCTIKLFEKHEKQNYEKLFHISMNFWYYGKIKLNDLKLL
jgi:hypothetical protein